MIVGLFLILFIVPVIKTIRKILRICKRKADKYSLEDKTVEETLTEGKVTLKHREHDRREDDSNP